MENEQDKIIKEYKNVRDILDDFGEDNKNCQKIYKAIDSNKTWNDYIWKADLKSKGDKINE